MREAVRTEFFRFLPRTGCMPCVRFAVHMAPFAWKGSLGRALEQRISVVAFTFVGSTTKFGRSPNRKCYISSL